MRVGRIGYINCFPIYQAIDRGIVNMPGELVTGTPAELNAHLAARSIDVSVVSAVEYARNASQYVLLPDLAISCDGAVQSVALFSRRPVEELTNSVVLVSASSRTSVHLLELLAREYWKIAPSFVEARAESHDLATLRGLPHEAVLVIGDAALLLSAAEDYPFKYDLGQVWHDWTGLPFVFAVWAAQRDANIQEVHQIHQHLLDARTWGLDHLDELAVLASERTGIQTPVCHQYLEGLDYALSYRHLEGLTSFFRRLAQHGVVRDGTLSFLSVA